MSLIDGQLTADKIGSDGLALERIFDLDQNYFQVGGFGTPLLSHKRYDPTLKCALLHAAYVACTCLCTVDL
ncbi:hypothetical protein N656DRAFT_774602 [Canariomyces notabilis]|uniref:Uncharacterized protein n=1 Tax=Canariomyces notabilis TaxID=2074819 RepID=A0AAN6YWI2_9PEZI|nr:hypothetical protein N656DRAFT_774602 [Canariomyces arenarius]